jgi:hypothetical protein
MNYLGDLEGDGKKILKLILQKYRPWRCEPAHIEFSVHVRRRHVLLCSVFKNSVIKNCDFFWWGQGHRMKDSKTVFCNNKSMNVCFSSNINYVTHAEEIHDHH